MLIKVKTAIGKQTKASFPPLINNYLLTLTLTKGKLIKKKEKQPTTKVID